MDWKISCCGLCQSVLPLFSSKCFIASGLKVFNPFWSLIHFEFILCMMLASVLMKFFYIWLSSFSSTIYWRNCLFSIMYSCLVCHRLSGHRCMGFSLDFIMFHWSTFLFLYQHHTVLIIVVLHHSLNSDRLILQLHSAFSRLFCYSVSFVLLYKM